MVVLRDPELALEVRNDVVKALFFAFVHQRPVLDVTSFSLHFGNLLPIVLQLTLETELLRPQLVDDLLLRIAVILHVEHLLSNLFEEGVEVLELGQFPEKDLVLFDEAGAQFLEAASCLVTQMVFEPDSKSHSFALEFDGLS